MTNRGCAGKELGRRSGGHFKKDGEKVCVWMCGGRRMKVEDMARDRSSCWVLIYEGKLAVMGCHGRHNRENGSRSAPEAK